MERLFINKHMKTGQFIDNCGFEYKSIGSKEGIIRSSPTSISYIELTNHSENAQVDDTSDYNFNKKTRLLRDLGFERIEITKEYTENG